MSLILFAVIFILLYLALREPVVICQIPATVFQKKSQEIPYSPLRYYHPEAVNYDLLDQYTTISRSVTLTLDFIPLPQIQIFNDEAYFLLEEKQIVTVLVKRKYKKNRVLYTVTKIITADGKIISV
jgi:hypothetical protein